MSRAVVLVLSVVVGSAAVGTASLAVWPAPGYTAIGLVLAVPSLALSVMAEVRAAKSGRQVQVNTIERLKWEIRSRLDRAVADPTMIATMTASSIRGKAKSIEVEERSPVITDAIIAEAVRSLANDLEREHTGPPLLDRLKILDPLVKDLEGSEIGLLSIAFFDRITAFHESQKMVIGSVAIALLIVAVLSIGTASVGLGIAVWALVVVLLLLALSNVRATRYWETGERESRGLRRIMDFFLVPKRPNLFFDFFLRVSMSDSALVHILWAPIWEVPLFLTVKRFSRMHAGRYSEARRLQRSLSHARDDLVVAQRMNSPLERELRKTIADLSRQLWVVTGDARYRT